MKRFGHLILSGKCNRTWDPKCILGPYGPDGIGIEVDGELIMNYDFSSEYKIEGPTLVMDMKESYTPFVASPVHIGIKELSNSFININWYEKNINPNTVVEAWEQYEHVIPFGKLVRYLIVRDVLIARKWNYLNLIPSWDVCLILPLYMKLCEDIPNFASRIKKSMEIGDQIRGNVKALDKQLGRKPFESQLDNLLEKIHSLSDELEFAYNVKKSGWNIRFGETKEPDYIINGVPVEHKSRFPYVESFTNINSYQNFDCPSAIQNLFKEVKNEKKGLKRAKIYFNNLSRVDAALCFQYCVEMTRYGPDKKDFNFSDMFCDFDIMLPTIMKSCEDGKVVAPYIKQISSDPRLITPFPKVI